MKTGIAKKSWIVMALLVAFSLAFIGCKKAASDNSSALLALLGGGSHVANVTASDAAVDASFGVSVAISSDGSTLAVGSSGIDTGEGAVYVYQKGPTGWTQTAKLTALDAGNNEYLGNCVAISSDGSTIASGMYGNNLGRGAVYVFVRPDDGWSTMTQTAKLTASDAADSDWLGSSVSLSGDGSVVAAGAKNADSGGTNRGAAYIFVRPGGGWSNGTQIAKLTASDGADNDNLGNSIAISSDGQTVVAGAEVDDVAANTNQGSAYVYVRPGGAWANGTETAKLTASDGAASDIFGNSTAISQDGSTIVVSAYADDIDTFPNQGSAYVFARPGGGWSTGTQTAKLTASDGAVGDNFGNSVSISFNGQVILVGASRVNVDVNADQGALYVFNKPAAGWASTSAFDSKPEFSNGSAGDLIGFSVSASSDGSVMAIGAVCDNSNAGSVYVLW